ncbi:MAG: FlgD immunoglobulin-like domain containing protein [Candidatus Latescibacterota bacterium]
MGRGIAVWVGWVVGLLALPAGAQVATWRIGQGGQTWDTNAQVQAGLVPSGTSIHPLELTAGQNLTSRLRWAEGQPADFTVEGNARVWDNSGTSGSVLLVDGVDTTSTRDRFLKPISQAGRAFFFDLGVAFPVNRIRFYPPPGHEDLAVKAFELFSSDGKTYNDIRRPVYQSLRRVDVSDTSVADLRFPAKTMRFIQLRVLARDGFELAECEIYGEGFVPQAGYLSQLHRFAEGPVNFGRLTVASTLLDRTGRPGAVRSSAQAQVRSGADDTPLTYYRRDLESGTETEVTESEHRALSVHERGPVRQDGANWSPWSAPLRVDSTGTFAMPLDLPSPRQYLQVRVAFAEETGQAVQLDQLAVEYSAPLVDRVVGEVALATDPAPARGQAMVPAGLDTTFLCDVRAEFTRDSQEGFRGIRLTSFPAPVFGRLEMGEPLTPVNPDSVVAQEDGFIVYFPGMVRANNQRVRLTFSTALFEYTTQVSAWLVGRGGGLPHPVEPGDASGDLHTSSLQILAAAETPAVELDARPAFTPNGDGRGDELAVTTLLSQFSGEVAVDVGVFDLSGRRVCSLFSGPQAPGAHEYVWSGRREGGELVPPGIYLCRLKVEADARSFVRTRPVGVVY